MDSQKSEKDIDKLKFRNEIEAFARLKGLGSVSGLYDNSINDKVSSSLSEVYHEGPNLSLENPGCKFNELVNKIETNAGQSCDTRADDLIVKCEGSTASEIVNESLCLSWDEYFMNIAILASLRSKDTTKVGSVLILHNKVVGMGYNGFPAGINESLLPTTRDGSFVNTKYAYTLHSEQNCILNSTVYDLSGASLYVTLFPCCRCAAILIQKKISEIVYLSDKHHDDPEYEASRYLLGLSNIRVRQYSGNILVNSNHI
jgi:dCMP deaminase